MGKNIKNIKNIDASVSIKKNFKTCKYCRMKTLMTEFIGKYEDVKLFENTCLYCGNNYIFRINERNGNFSKTENLQFC